jgi:hypothetical protein
MWQTFNYNIVEYEGVYNLIIQFEKKNCHMCWKIQRKPERNRLQILLANLEKLERTMITMLHHTRERERESCAIYLWIAWSLDLSITLCNRQLYNPTIYSIITWLWYEENFNKKSITTSVGKFGENPGKKTITHLLHHTFKDIVLLICACIVSDSSKACNTIWQSNRTWRPMRNLEIYWKDEYIIYKTFKWYACQ